MVLPGSTSAAIAAEWVIPEHPMVSTRASSIIPFFNIKGELAGALLGCAPAYAVSKTGNIGDLLCAYPQTLLRYRGGFVLCAFCNAEHFFNLMGVLHIRLPPCNISFCFRFIIHFFFSSDNRKTKTRPQPCADGILRRARPDSCSCALFPLNFPGV